MSINEKSGLKYFEFNFLTKHQIPHGIFTRVGGCSPKPWHTLNVATSVGDSKNNVIENRQRIMEVFNHSIDSIFDVWQIHSDEVIITNTPRNRDEPHQKGDAIITNRPNVFIMMLFADCVPIFLFDHKKRVIAIVHAGWQGTVKKIVQKTIGKMEKIYYCRPEDIFAGIGPSVCVNHYIVGDKVVQLVRKNFPHSFDSVLIKDGIEVHFDLWKANQLLLEKARVRLIENQNICTACNTQDWFSHRAESGMTGRFAGVIGLPA